LGSAEAGVEVSAEVGLDGEEAAAWDLAEEWAWGSAEAGVEVSAEAGSRVGMGCRMVDMACRNPMVITRTTDMTYRSPTAVTRGKR
jgi:hypothetical protein